MLYDKFDKVETKLLIRVKIYQNVFREQTKVKNKMVEDLLITLYERFPYLILF